MCIGTQNMNLTAVHLKILASLKNATYFYTLWLNVLKCKMQVNL